MVRRGRVQSAPSLRKCAAWGRAPDNGVKRNVMHISSRAKLSAAITAVFSWSAIGVAHAVPGGGLMGTDVLIRYVYSGESTLESTVTVGASVEMSCTGGGGGNISACGYLTDGKQSVDIDADSFTYRMSSASTNFSAVAENGFTFANLGPGYTIGGVTLDTNIATMNSSRISFTGNSVSVYMAGVHVDDGSYFKLTLQPVPEPATAAMLLAGLLAVASAARRASRN